MGNAREFTAEWARKHMQLAHHQVPDFATGGNALARVRSVLPDYAGLRITSTYRSPAKNASIGGAKNSYHMDRANPAVDVGGPWNSMDAFARDARRAGGWREGPLWQVKGHFDHAHVADQGMVLDSMQSFDKGGWLEPGLTMAYNGTGRPEQVVPVASGAVPGAAPAGQVIYQDNRKVTVKGQVWRLHELERELSRVRKDRDYRAGR
jgi:hypothetical protein